MPLLAWLPPETRGESMAGCAALIALLALTSWSGRDDRSTARGILVVAALVGAAVAWAGEAPAVAVVPLSTGVLALVAGIVGARGSADERLVRAAIWALVVAAVGVALLAWSQRLWGLERWAAIVEQQPDLPDRAAVLARLGRGRAFGAFATPAALAGYLVLTLPVTLALAVSHRGGLRWLLLPAVALQVVAVWFAASATAVAALLAAVLLALLARGAGRRALLPAALVPLVLLAAVVLVRGDRLLDPDASESPWRLRAGNMRAAAAMAADHPWLGVGPGGFAEHYSSYRRPGDNEVRHAHNLPLELAAEWGWPAGATLSLLFFGVFVSPLWRERRAEAWRRGLAVGLAAFALQNLADFTAFMPSLLWTAALLYGLLRPPPAPGAVARPPSPVLAGTSLAVVAIAVAATAAGGLGWNARIAARAAAFEGQGERALRDAERSVKLAPWDVDAALLLAGLTADAELADASGHPGRALRRAERAVSLSPTRAAARALRARVRLATGDLPGAYADLVMAARLHPVRLDYARARDELGARMTIEEGESR